MSDTISTLYYEARDDQSLWWIKDNGEHEPYDTWTRKWQNITHKGRETRFTIDKLRKQRARNHRRTSNSSSNNMSSTDNKKGFVRANEEKMSLEVFLTTATAIDMAIVMAIVSQKKQHMTTHSKYN